MIAKDTKVVFDPEKHEYWVDGKKKPGPSEIMKYLGLSDDWTGVDSFYRDRGIAVHKAIELYINQNLDEKSLDPVCVSYVEEFKDWWEDLLPMGKGTVMTEQFFYSRHYDFCGTIDLIIPGMVWDFKTTKSLKHFTNEIQGAFYRQLANEHFPITESYGFSVLQLSGVGPAVPVPYEARESLVACVMELYRTKKRGRK